MNKLRQPAGVDTVANLSTEAFYNNYVARKKPVLIKEATKDWKALHWDLNYFYKIGKNVPVRVKVGDVSLGNVDNITLSEYTQALASSSADPTKRPPYLHDYPIFNAIPALIKDIEPFTLELFPKWYWNQWWNFIQFFMGPANSLTPLHFDTLCTHNLFFQIVGHKRFTLVPADQKDLCYMRDWRWSKVNPNKLDLQQYPLFADVDLMEVMVGPGDILYLPPGTLHQVESLSMSVSFNIDWHTRKSVLKGAISSLHGAPLENGFYNMLVMAGLWLKLPNKYIFPRYKSYLSYIS